jgi:hypothetical protein
MDKVADSPDVVGKFFGEREGFANEPRTVLTNGVIEAFSHWLYQRLCGVWKAAHWHRLVGKSM